MEIALRQELNKITEIKNKIFPTNVPEGAVPPFLIYMTSKKRLKDLNGTLSNQQCDILLNIMSNSYMEMKSITQKVENLISGFPLRTIGIEKIYIEDSTIDSISETFEKEMKLQRGIISFRIFFKEE